jgi:hypothetical protein
MQNSCGRSGRVIDDHLAIGPSALDDGALAGYPYSGERIFRPTQDLNLARSDRNQPSCVGHSTVTGTCRVARLLA